MGCMWYEANMASDVRPTIFGVAKISMKYQKGTTICCHGIFITANIPILE